EAVRQSERAARSRVALAERFEASVEDAISPALAERVETTYASWLRSLRPGWYTDLGLLRRHLRPTQQDAGLDYRTGAAAIGRWRALMAAEGWHTSQARGLAGAFGRHYLGRGTDWVGVQGTLDVVRQLTDLLGDLRQYRRVTELLMQTGASTTLDRPTETLRA